MVFSRNLDIVMVDDPLCPLAIKTVNQVPVVANQRVDVGLIVYGQLHQFLGRIDLFETHLNFIILMFMLIFDRSLIGWIINWMSPMIKIS